MHGLRLRSSVAYGYSYGIRAQPVPQWPRTRQNTPCVQVAGNKQYRPAGIMAGLHAVNLIGMPEAGPWSAPRCRCVRKLWCVLSNIADETKGTRSTAALACPASAVLHKISTFPQPVLPGE